MKPHKRRAPGQELAMTSQEFETALKKLFPETPTATVAALSRLLHRNRRTVRRWRNDHSAIPPETILLLRAMVKWRLSAADIKTLAQYTIP